MEKNQVKLLNALAEELKVKPLFKRGDIVYIKKKYVKEIFSLEYTERVTFELGMPYVVDSVVPVPSATRKGNEFAILVFGASQATMENCFQKTSPLTETIPGAPSAANSKYEEFCDFVFKYATKNKFGPFNNKYFSSTEISFQKIPAYIRIYKPDPGQNSDYVTIDFNYDFFNSSPSYNEVVSVSSVDEIVIEIEKLITYSKKFDKSIKSIKKHYKSIEKIAKGVDADVDDFLTPNINFD